MSAQELILAGVGMIISLGFSYIPPLSKWFYGLDTKYRGLVMVGFALLSAVVVFGVSCTGLFQWIACSKEGAMDLLKAFLAVIIGNQLTYLVTPESPTKVTIEEAKASAMHVSVEPVK